MTCPSQAKTYFNMFNSIKLAKLDEANDIYDV